jgi:hypothetical protein
MHSSEVWEHPLPSITRQNHTRHKTTSLDKLGGICVPQGTSTPPPPPPTFGQALLYAQEPDQIFFFKNIKTYHKFSSVFGGILTEHNIFVCKALVGAFCFPECLPLYFSFFPVIIFSRFSCQGTPLNQGFLKSASL